MVAGPNGWAKLVGKMIHTNIYIYRERYIYNIYIYIIYCVFNVYICIIKLYMRDGKVHPLSECMPYCMFRGPMFPQKLCPWSMRDVLPLPWIWQP